MFYPNRSQKDIRQIFFVHILSLSLACPSYLTGYFQFLTKQNKNCKVKISYQRIVLGSFSKLVTHVQSFSLETYNIMYNIKNQWIIFWQIVKQICDELHDCFQIVSRGQLFQERLLATLLSAILMHLSVLDVFQELRGQHQIRLGNSHIE